LNSIYFYLLVAVVAGAMMPTQAATNNRMAEAVGSPVIAALISFLIGTVALFLYAVTSGGTMSSLAAARNAPPLAWIGGLLGAFFVTATVALLPRLGVAMTFSVIIAGQMLVTLVLDHFGLLGVPVKEISFARIGGMLLITAGVILIRKF
jgi:transporter family-2 protein